MSRDELREQLARLADTAPVASVPSDTYRRGRRATARSRIAASVVAAGCLVLGAVLGVTLLVGREGAGQPGYDGQPVGRAVVGVPNHLYAPPGQLQPWGGAIVGRAAAAFVDGRGQVVVVDAATGAYRRYDPTPYPENAWPTRGVHAVALSPDGRKLAWGAVAPHLGYPDDLWTSVTVVDLVGGQIYEQRVSSKSQGAAHAVNVLGLTWSANSQWVGWGGVPVSAWTPDTYEPLSKYVGGVIHFFGTRHHAASIRTVPAPTPAELADLRSGGLTTWTRTITVSDTGMLATVTGSTARPTVAGHLAAGRVLLHRSDPHRSTTVVETEPGRTSTLPLITVAPGISGLTIATDLMRPGHLTVPRAAPSWSLAPPGSGTGHPAVLVGAGATALLVVAAALWRRRRRRLTHM
ncbi:hypothetical protein GCM10028801_07940 [Nocardioides maradonensis]